MMIGTRKNAWEFAVALAMAGIAALPGLASAASVGEIMAKYIEVTGGREAQEAVKSMLQKREINDIEAGMQMEMTIYFKDGNMMAVTEMGETVAGFSDDVTWMTNPDEGYAVLEGPAAETMRQQASFNPHLHWQDTYMSSEIVGAEAGETKIKITTFSGNVTTYYFDDSSGLMTKLECAGPFGGTMTVEFRDYKKVGAITVAHKILVDYPEYYNMEQTILSVELNAEIDDSVFGLPSQIRAQLPKGPAPNAEP